MKTHDDCQHDSTEDAGEGGINVNCDRCKGASRGDDDADDDGGLRNGLCFYIKDQFHRPRKIGEGKNWKEGLENSVGVALVQEEGTQGQCRRRKTRATAPPWFLVRAKNLVGVVHANVEQKY